MTHKQRVREDAVLTTLQNAGHQWAVVEIERIIAERNQARADVRRYHTLAELAQEECDRLRVLLLNSQKEGE